MEIDQSISYEAPELPPSDDSDGEENSSKIGKYKRFFKRVRPYENTERPSRFADATVEAADKYECIKCKTHLKANSARLINHMRRHLLKVCGRNSFFVL